MSWTRGYEASERRSCAVCKGLEESQTRRSRERRVARLRRKLTSGNFHRRNAAGHVVTPLYARSLNVIYARCVRSRPLSLSLSCPLHLAVRLSPEPRPARMVRYTRRTEVDLRADSTGLRERKWENHACQVIRGNYLSSRDRNVASRYTAHFARVRHHRVLVHEGEFFLSEKMRVSLAPAPRSSCVCIMRGCIRNNVAFHRSTAGM